MLSKRNYFVSSIFIFLTVFIYDSAAADVLIYDSAAADKKHENTSVVVTKLKDDGIYIFRNKHDSGILTAINIMGDFPPIVTDKWRDAATQKWRVVGSYFYSGYQLRPTSDEAKLLNLDASTNLISQDFPGFGVMNGNQYWKSHYVGNGLHQLKNVKTDECLLSKGNGKRVGVGKCFNIPKEHWQIDEI